MTIEKQMLNDVRKDACEKIKTVGEEELVHLVKAAGDILYLDTIAQKEGLLVLEELIQYMGPDYLDTVLMPVIDACMQDMIIEIGTNEYWSQDPQGIQAMVYYFYLQGAASIQCGDDPDDIKVMYAALVPDIWRPAYDRLLEDMESEMSDDAVFNRAFNIRPEFKNPDLAGKLRVLEKEIEEMDSGSLEHVSEWMCENYCEAARCLYGLGAGTGKKLLSVMEKYCVRPIMWEMMRLHKRYTEKTLLRTVEEVSDIIRKFQAKGGNTK